MTTLHSLIHTIAAQPDPVPVRVTKEESLAENIKSAAWGMFMKLTSPVCLARVCLTYLSCNLLFIAAQDAKPPAPTQPSPLELIKADEGLMLSVIHELRILIRVCMQCRSLGLCSGGGQQHHHHAIHRVTQQPHELLGVLFDHAVHSHATACVTVSYVLCCVQDSVVQSVAQAQRGKGTEWTRKGAKARLRSVGGGGLLRNAAHVLAHLHADVALLAPSATKESKVSA